MSRAELEATLAASRQQQAELRNPHQQQAPELSPDAVQDLFNDAMHQFNLPALSYQMSLGAQCFTGELGLGLSDNGSSVWHWGSNAKALTATVCAVLVEQGQIGWDTTLGEVFKEADCADEQCRALTVSQLLHHRAGLAHEAPLPEFNLASTPAECRLITVRDVLSRPPERAADTSYHYSNLGYVVLGCVLEQITAVEWELLVQQTVAKPLGMQSLGFGMPTGGQACR